MKATILMLMLLSFTATAQYPTVSIRQIQEVPLDSLWLLDTCMSCASWLAQASPLLGDTVEVTAVCVVPPTILDYISNGFTMLLCDTGAISSWGGIFVRVNSPADTLEAIIDGFRNVRRGDVVRMTGIVEEFPAGSPLSETQFRPVPGYPISILGTANVPAPFHKQIGDFNTGIYGYGQRPHFVTGEPFEDLVVEFNNVAIDAKVNTSRGTFSMTDTSGNQVSDYDASHAFTLGHGVPPGPPDSIWAITYPRIGVGTRIDSILGFIMTTSGSEALRGYRIAPVYRPDIMFSAVRPLVYQHRRLPVVVPSTSVAEISARAVKQGTGAGIATVSLFFSINTAPFVSVPMGLVDSGMYRGAIPLQPVNTFVHYYIQAVDSLGYSTILANSGITGSDSSRGFFFYTVLDRPLTIRDIQYTPYPYGRSAYVGATVSVSGIVTADTAHIQSSLGQWFLQTGREPWNAIWMSGADSTLDPLRNGDSITVTGEVAENFDFTRIQNIREPAVIHSRGNAEPTPVVLPTAFLAPPAGEQYEAMLVKIANVRVAGVTPFGGGFTADDGSGPARVDLGSGKHRYTTDPGDTGGGRILIRNGDHISFLTGILTQQFGQYDLLPRTDSDFGVITSVHRDPGGGTPHSFVLEQNYPNPFNPGTEIGLQLSAYGEVTLNVFDVLGREVAVLVNEPMAPGKYKVLFDGSRLASGVYYYRLDAGTFVQTKKMLLLRFRI